MTRTAGSGWLLQFSMARTTNREVRTKPSSVMFPPISAASPVPARAPAAVPRVHDTWLTASMVRM